MCGIVGYVGSKGTVDVLIAGLKRQEYRGYDSAGIAVITHEGHISTAKKAGKLQALVDELAVRPVAAGSTGIGHTRWATHGAPIDANAHPHLADDGKLALIHNGIIENYAEIRAEMLAAGHEFVSDTDTEVAAVLVGHLYSATSDLRTAFAQAADQFAVDNHRTGRAGLA